jgi:hypothetical protein
MSFVIWMNEWTSIESRYTKKEYEIASYLKKRRRRKNYIDKWTRKWRNK